MTARLTPSRRLRRALDAAVEARELEWSDTDLAVTLPTIEATVDRIDMLRGKLDAEARRDGPLAVRAVQVASELRQLEAQLSRMVAALGLDEDNDEPTVKSAQHQGAAQTRWNRRSHRRVGA